MMSQGRCVKYGDMLEADLDTVIAMSLLLHAQPDCEGLGISLLFSGFHTDF